MKYETIKHAAIPISGMSLEIADKFKDQLSSKQYEILKHNVYTIEFDKDTIGDKYHGCGSGWCEIDKEGNFVDLKYFNNNFVRYAYCFEWDEEPKIVAGDDKGREELFTHDSTEQNVDLFCFSDKDLEPFFLPNGNIKIIVNFSATQLVRF